VAYRKTARTEARLAETRERILAAGLEQVADGGYASASVQAVAARAGVATGSVYRHFESKAQLFAEVFNRAAEPELALVQRIAAEAEGPAHERIAAATEAFARRALAAPVLAYAQLVEPVGPAVEAERLRLRRGYRDAFALVLREGVERGELTPHDTETYAAAMVGALGEALVGPLAERRSGEALIANLIQFVTQAVPTQIPMEA
jgi:AcrR family transcriptional regulator